ncbi:MAG: hypothetical protein ACFFFT_04945 [Candidatus Thorarchaeota archaeon]
MKIFFKLFQSYISELNINNLGNNEINSVISEKEQWPYTLKKMAEIIKGRSYDEGITTNFLINEYISKYIFNDKEITKEQLKNELSKLGPKELYSQK